MIPYDGVVLAGGRARRMGGVPKPALEVAGRSLLDVALAALSDAAVRVVVGLVSPRAGALVTSEQPPGGGPVAALAAALAHVSSPVCVVLAADLPFVTADHVAQLVASMDGRSAVAVDREGREQPLLAAYDVAALRAALPEVVDGAPMRVVLERLDRRQVHLAGDPEPWFDCDVPGDLQRARALADD
ncbi:MAG TPA: NTP transferase domain-containing protein [Mycobacteriales bacterium]|nr:NTP transferase domain-containing protein [Mycobacteriales bacterium]